MRTPFSKLRFRTRLALIMFLTMVSTSAILMYTYVQYNREIKAYVTVQTSDLLGIIQLTQTRIPPDMNRTQALEVYKKALTDAGMSSVTVASPSGEVVASTTPGQVGKRIKHRRTAAKLDPIKISAELHGINVDPNVEEKPYVVEFPLIQGDKVLGSAQISGELDAVQALLRRMYMVRLAWTLVTMLAGIFAVVYLAFRFTKPVDELAAAAQQVAQGNLNVALPATGTGEMNRLALTFNQMVSRLRESHALQERLYEAEKLSILGRFAATVAHEVRNSLNFINLSVDQIRAKHLDGDERTARELHRNLKNVKEEIGRLNRLVNDVLAAGRMAPPALEPCVFREVVQQAVAMVEKQAAQQRIRVSTHFSEDGLTLQADPAQIKTCFLNILTNAIQAMPRGGEILVSARKIPGTSGAGSVEICFADTGPGIAPQDRERVFAPFFSTKATGFGLGLAITRKIVEDHGGRIAVAASEAPGTVIVVVLPLDGPPLSQPALAESSSVA